MPPQISDALEQLAAILRAPLLAEVPPSVAIDRQLAELAIRRHRVGPLLYAAVKAGGLNADPAVQEALAQCYRMNALRLAVADAFLKDLAAKFWDAKIPWIAFKGVPLARQLYPDPAWRHAHDIDVLVPADMHARASRLLTDNGLKIVNTRLRPDHWIERATAALAKDVMLRQPKMAIDMELHRRLFFGRDAEAGIPLLRDAFRPRLGLSPTDIPSVPPGAGSALYLILHGASSRWFRLKWLADIVPLTRQIDAAQLDAIAGAARQMGAETTVKAGLLLLDWVFGELTAGPLGVWLGESAGRGLVEARAQIYLAALDRPQAHQATREGDRFDSLSIYYALFDDPAYRASVVLRGGAWIALKAMASLVPDPANSPRSAPDAP